MFPLYSTVVEDSEIYNRQFNFQKSELVLYRERERAEQ